MMYKDPQIAFASISADQKTLHLNDILESQPIKRAQISPDDAKLYLLSEVFQDEYTGLDYVEFKKFFFPSLVLINDNKETQMNYKMSKTTQKFNFRPQNFVKERMIKLDKYLKFKVQQKWTSVRQAFLDLDSNHDGFIEANDMVAVLGEEKTNFLILNKLFRDITHD